MQRMTLTPDDLLRQAAMTAETYLSQALQWVKARELPQKDWPAYVAIYVRAASQDFQTAVTLAGVQDLNVGLSSELSNLVDATGQGLEHLGNAVKELAIEMYEQGKK